MGDVAVENPLHTIPPHKKQPVLDAIPNIDSLEGGGSDGGDEYATLKKLQRHLEYVDHASTRQESLTWNRYIQLQEEYIKDEQRSAHMPESGRSRSY